MTRTKAYHYTTSDGQIFIAHFLNPELIHLGLSLLPSFGPIKLRKLLSIVGSTETLWQISERDLIDCGFDPHIALRFVNERGKTKPEVVWQACRAQNIRFLWHDSSEYPRRLKEIPDAPLGLFLRGTLPDGVLVLAVVGTRQPSSYGVQATRLLIRDLASAGVVIISGLALGIDGIAHQETLSGGGSTVAVLGSGVDRVYPVFHTGLAGDMLRRGGGLVSEYPPGTPALRHHFPIRNRIIAGMVDAVLITEAPRGSGALLTAELALQYNRDIFAVPGALTNEKSSGTNTLIQRGANLVQSADDILGSYRLPSKPPPVVNIEELTESEKMVLTLFHHEPLTVDQLTQQGTLTTSTVNATLALLELKGWVRQLDPVHYIRIR